MKFFYLGPTDAAGKHPAGKPVTLKLPTSKRGVFQVIPNVIPGTTQVDITDAETLKYVQQRYDLHGKPLYKKV